MLLGNVLQGVLHPSVMFLAIPLMAVFFWGLTSVVRALRNAPEDSMEDPAGLRQEIKELRNEIKQLRARVEESLQTAAHR